jgi:endonuclease YncB( thermonuclease family)
MKRLISILLVSFLSAGAVANEIHGKVTGVSDGDTITVLTGDLQPIKVRLSGIDAPHMQVIAIRSR